MPKKSKKGRSTDTEEASPCKQSRVTSPPTPSPLCFQTPESLFESLIQPVGPEQFFAEYWEKKPLHLTRSDPAVASYYQSLFQLADLQSLCSQGLQFYRDVNVVRCINGNKKVLNKEGQVKNGTLTTNLKNKASIQFHQPQRFKEELWRIMEKLETFFGALVGSNVYITPEQSQGLPAHYDDVEVFILQLEGEKRWRLYNPTVPLAAEYNVESEERIGSPTHDIILKTGDLLYFPRGTIHQAETPAGVHHSTHLTLSTYQKMSWGDLLSDAFPSMLFERSRSEVSLREGMPRRILLANGNDVNANRRLAAILRSVADDLEADVQKFSSTHLKKDFISNRLPPFSEEQLPAGRIPTLEDTVCLRFKDHMIITVESSQPNTEEATEQFVYVFHSLKNSRENHMMGEACDDEEEQWDSSTGLRFSLSNLPALHQLMQAEHLPVQQLQLPTEQDKLSLSLALWSEGLLQVI
ncbi:unnamed protein product [Ophioblennius macclurei]